MSKFSINPGHNLGKKLCKTCRRYHSPTFMMSDVEGLCKYCKPRGEEEERMHPLITSWNATRGFGFVNSNVFVHVTELPKGMIVTENSRISYTLKTSVKGFAARKIKDKTDNPIIND